MNTPYDAQLADKQATSAQVLAGHVAAQQWLSPVSSAPERFRNKAKLAVGGTVAQPTLGLTGLRSPDVDLRECGIQERAIWDVVPDLAGFVTLVGLEPYHVTERRGSFKFIHVTAAPNGDLMVRFVVREQADVPAIRSAFPALHRRLPQIRVAAVNVLSEHVAALAGPVDEPLTSETQLPVDLGGFTVYLRANSFFQTNTDVARQLYAQTAAWVDRLSPDTVLDLYCGAGGFALAVAGQGRSVRGVEIDPDAVAGARRSAAQLLEDHPESGPVEFECGDASVLTLDAAPGLVIVNPPRRGIEALAATLNASGPQHVIYSSCNPNSLARDLDQMPGYRVVEARLFDMFPQTDHCEVAVLLERTT